jgi:rubrerythrin
MKKGRAKVAETVKADTNDLQAIELGQEQERKAIEFYGDAAAKASDAGSKDLFSRLKAEEEKHLALLTDLYDYMVNPGVWSVRDERSHFDS